MRHGQRARSHNRVWDAIVSFSIQQFAMGEEFRNVRVLVLITAHIVLYIFPKCDMEPWTPRRTIMDPNKKRQALRPRVNTATTERRSTPHFFFSLLRLITPFRSPFPSYTSHCLYPVLTASTKTPIGTMLYINSPLTVEEGNRISVSVFRSELSRACSSPSPLVRPPSSLPFATYRSRKLYTTTSG